MDCLQQDEDNEMSKADAILLSVGVDDEMVYSKSSTFQVWLFGIELSDTICAFTEEGIYILASKKKIDFLKGLESLKENESEVPPVHLMVRNKNDKDQANYEKLVSVISSSKAGKVVGQFPKDKYTNDFYTDFKEVLSSKSFETFDLTTVVALLTAPKDEAEIEITKKASQMTCDVFSKYLKEEIAEIVDSERKVKHSKLTEGVEKAAGDRKFIKNADISKVEVCYAPIVQSGGNYNLKFSATSDKNNLHFGTITCSLGIRYKYYCSNLTRTLLVNPTEKQQEYYELLVALQQHVIDSLTDGTPLSEVYNKGLEYVKEHEPSLPP